MNDLTQTLESKAGCIASAMQVIGSKWTALILRDLASGPIGFCELQKAVGDIKQRGQFTAIRFVILCRVAARLIRHT